MSGLVHTANDHALVRPWVKSENCKTDCAKIDRSHLPDLVVHETVTGFSMGFDGEKFWCLGLVEVVVAHGGSTALASEK